MINVDPRIKAAFRSDSSKKEYVLIFLDENFGVTHLNNSNLLSDNLTITENLCSEEQLHYGRCEGNMFEFEMEYDPKSYAGQIFDAYLILDDMDELPFPIGRYIIDTETASNDRNSKSITAYDIMYVLNTLDITYWYYNEITFPITVKQMRDSLLSYVSQEQETVSLVNDNAVIETSPWDGETDITFEMVMPALLEPNGVFGSINRNGLFTYISLDAVDQSETYPSKNTFPSRNLYPKSIKGKNYYIDPHLIKSDIMWEDYTCRAMDLVQVRNKAGVVITEYPLPGRESFNNVYVIQNNPIMECFSTSTLESVIINFASKVGKVSYRPCDANILMDLSLEVGDAVTLTNTDGQKIPTFILKRTMTGIVDAFDEIEATGYEYFINDPPETNNGAIDEIMDDLTDIEDRLSTVETKQAQGDGSIKIRSVSSLPASPERNVLYLVQGKIYVN